MASLATLQYYEIDKNRPNLFGYKGIDDSDRKVVAEQKHGESREEFFKRIGVEPDYKMYGSDKELDRKANSVDRAKREELVYQGYGLDKLINSWSRLVREAVAKQGYRLDMFAQL